MVRTWQDRRISECLHGLAIGSYPGEGGFKSLPNKFTLTPGVHASAETVLGRLFNNSLFSLETPWMTVYETQLSCHSVYRIA